MLYLGIDLGTTGCKSMLFDNMGNIKGSSYIESDLIFTAEGVEQDANDWWEKVKQTVRETVKSSNCEIGEIAALAVSSQGISGVAVDSDGNALSNAISWLDSRACSEAAEVEEFYGLNRLFETTGKRALPYTFPQLLWVKKHKPQIFEKTYKYLMPHDFIVCKMTGLSITDYSMASGTLAFDIEEKKWVQDIFKHFEIDVGLFPSIGRLGDKIGSLTPWAAGELGLSCSTQVVLGAQDQRCCSIGAGIKKGVITASLGTAAAVCSIMDGIKTDPSLVITCNGFTENEWINETVISTCGAALKWLKNTFFETMDYMSLDMQAQNSPAGSNGAMFFPYLSGEQDASGGGFIGLSLSTNKSDVIRSVMEAVAFQIKKHILHHERLIGEVHELRLFGGGAKSEIWCSIIAEVTGKTTVVPRTIETGCLGAAMIAAVGAGDFADLDAARVMAGEPSKRYLPEKRKTELYESIYQSYMHADNKIFGNRGAV